MVSLPRLVVAAAASSAGKTTIATGLMGALRDAGHEVAGFKTGPDFIDPGYHALATGRPGRNLDAVLTGEDLVPRLLVHGATFPARADLAVVEGAMGLFDGQLGGEGAGSTAHVARLIDAPIVLVVDAAGSSRTAAASALGLRAFDPSVRISAVVVNRVGSPRHAAEVAGVFERAGVPVLGMVPRSRSIVAPSRHLGLVPAAERRESAATIEALAAHVAEHVDLGAVVDVATSAPDLDVVAWDPAAMVAPVAGRPLVAVLAGRAFTFRYAETTELLAAAGCSVIEVDPLRDTELPAGLCGLYIGGGFPELHAVELSGNVALRAAIGEAIRAGLPVVAECAGQLYLGSHLDGHPMVGAIGASARMTPRLTLGYRRAIAPAETLLAARGAEVVGHEFHRTLTEPAHGTPAAWSWQGRADGFSADPSGSGRPSLHASYLHLHWAGVPSCAQRFADAAAAFASRSRGADAAGAGARHAVREHTGQRSDGIDLHHHGDHDLRPGLVDLAVNVRLPGPPEWLAAEIEQTIPALGSYPDSGAAREAIAAAHGVPADMVLPTAGGAEAFSLIARTLTADHPLVVHPQFTEPEASLRAAGHAVQRWLLPVAAGAPVPSLAGMPSWADALFVGNPTNPTGWLHRRDDLLTAGHGRVLVVDEAFMDATDERESLIAPSMPGRLVLRSLSKTWGLAGLRVGYAVGDPRWVARLEQAQPTWPVSAPAVAAMIATSSPEARAEAAARYREVDRQRAYLVSALGAAGFGSVSGGAPFVLVDTSPLGPGSVREDLAAAGFAVRRGESFPGLGPTWIRVKVPEPVVTDAFVAALAAVPRTT
ncbi:cobyrinate a,c-diamide synthase [Propionicicella superfundia]|uniref:cobyrinate a,c-diamide synthase n=1 Tax=Propionicicella superfundia TaxID=348582 RepID=UPI00041BB146|nr:cobyrinate a,c-diamide synthase [Propionicicella superfundia]